MKRLFSLSLLLLLLLALVLSGCSAAGSSAPGSFLKGEDSASADANSSVPTEPEFSGSPLGETETGAGGALPDIGGRKVIFSSFFSIETKDFAASCAALEALIAKHGAYIEASNIYTGDGVRTRARSANYTLRVPAAQYAALLADSGQIGTVVTRSDNNQDITDSYYDTEARLKTLETKEERLLALLERAEIIDDVISLNDALEQTRYEIESLTGTLKKYDSLISYATVTLSVTEVSEITEPAAVNASLGERISRAFGASVQGVGAFLQGLLVVLIAALPVLGLLAVPAAAALIIIFAVRRRNKKKRAAREHTV